MSTSPTLVTGAAGFVGSEIVRQLLADGQSVRALVRRPEQQAALTRLGAEVVLGDITSPEELKPAMAGVTGVYHIAALFRQADQPDETYRAVNIQGVQNVIDAAVEAGVKRMIHCSTVGVHGHVEHPPADESCPFAPGDIYQRTKLEGEQLALKAFRAGPLEGAVIRPAMIYGPHDERTRKIFRMIAGKKFFYVGKGDNLVHFIDVRDLARAFRLAMDRETAPEGVYIISGKRAMPLKEFSTITAEQIGVAPPRLKIPVKPMQWAGSLCEAVCVPLGINPPLYRRRVDFYTKDRSFTSARAKAELGFEPAQDPEQEIADILASYRDEGAL